MHVDQEMVKRHKCRAPLAMAGSADWGVTENFTGNEKAYTKTNFC
jgi:hypothetical protein